MVVILDIRRSVSVDLLKKPLLMSGFSSKTTVLSVRLIAHSLLWFASKSGKSPTSNQFVIS